MYQAAHEFDFICSAGCLYYEHPAEQDSDTINILC